MLKKLFKTTLTKKPQDEMIRYVVKILAQKENKSIRAITNGFEIPQKVVRKSTGEGFIPEVTAEKHNQFRLFAVESKETLSDATVEERWALYAEYARQNDASFYIVFPTGMVAGVKEKIEALGIDANLWQAPRTG